jgi:hypothetical protein
MVMSRIRKLNDADQIFPYWIGDIARSAQNSVRKAISDVTHVQKSMRRNALLLLTPYD